MPRYFLRLSYDGSPFQGWQVQPGQRTVQGELESAFFTFLRESIQVVGCGRTDTGVHAHEYVAHVDVPEAMDPAHIRFKLNCLLPAAIAIREVWPVSEDLHARFSAEARTYRYFIHREPDPFLHAYSWRISEELNLEAMNRAASELLVHTDFASFCKAGSDVQTTLCDVTVARWFEQDRQWVFEITANRFLRNMVRAIVGTLVEVGKGKRNEADFRQVIEARNRDAAGTSAKAHGLFLWKIEYPETSKGNEQNG